jgi:hypothetical protein
MPKRITPLSDMKIQKVKSKDKPITLFDGGGLFLLVTPSGGKLWRFKYRFAGKENKLAFGAYPEISLLDARKRRDEARWFPFVEIITAEFKNILLHCEAGFDVVEIEEKIIAKFDGTRMERILERWVAKPHFAARTNLLKTAITAFKNNEPITVIKILLTEIEGVLNDVYWTTHGGQGAKLKDLLVFAEASAELKAGGSNTLLFPKAFGRYLREYTFANFDPSTNTGTAGSRNAVGHGAASQESYTMSRALQAILTLDQLAFYT